MTATTDLDMRLKNARIKKRLSQSDVANKLNISRQAVSRWENGKSVPDADNLALLSQLYGVSLDELLNCASPNKTEGKHENENQDSELSTSQNEIAPESAPDLSTSQSESVPEPASDLDTSQNKPAPETASDLGTSQNEPVPKPAPQVSTPHTPPHIVSSFNKEYVLLILLLAFSCLSCWIGIIVSTYVFIWTWRNRRNYKLILVLAVICFLTNLHNVCVIISFYLPQFEEYTIEKVS